MPQLPVDHREYTHSPNDQQKILTQTQTLHEVQSNSCASFSNLREKTKESAIKQAVSQVTQFLLLAGICQVLVGQFAHISTE
jgi:predicted lysophospholipase L1 biosynthesis ABC-type transport system permease subunit